MTTLLRGLARRGGATSVAASASRPLVILIAVGAVGCEVDRRPVFEYAMEPTAIAGEIHHTGDHLGDLFRLRLFEDALIALDHAGERNIHVIDAESGRLRASVGAVGDGPAEFRQPVAIARDADGRPWVVDMSGRRAVSLDLALLDDGTSWAGEIVRFESSPVLDAVRTASGSWIVEGVSTEGRFEVLAANGSALAVQGEVAHPDLYPPTAARLEHWSWLGAHPSLDRFVVVGRNRSDIAFIDAEARIVGEVQPPIRTEPEFRVVRQTLQLTDDSPVAYLDVATSERHVYALFGGRTDAEYGPIQNFGRDVHVFDWEGNLVQVLRLDRDAFKLEVDETRGRLYTIQSDPMPAILRFDLPASLATAVPR